MPHTDITVELSGIDGNAFAIMATVRRALVRASYSNTTAKFVAQAYSCSSYDKLLQLVMEYVHVE